MYILLENRKTQLNCANSHYFFGRYTRISCTQPNEVENCLAEINSARRSGKYLVGYIAYETIYGLNKRLLPDYHHIASHPLIDFYIFDHHQILMQSEVEYLLQALANKSDYQASIQRLNFNYDLNHYESCFNKIKSYIKNGETYQLNFTGRYQFQLQGSPLALYRMLREKQKVEFSALFANADWQLLSFSPELFFEKSGNHLRVKPMKGTMPRSGEIIIDNENKHQLISSKKILAENLIIVDLIRNDVSTIAKAKSVNVPQLFEIEEYETIYQLTSTVTGEVDKDIAFSDIISALFPCGSVTGAPKIRTMQIIRELEQADRGIYTGAIGYITPENDMCFNVAIRTLHLSHYHGEMGVGGGIVHDAIMMDEFNEIKAKAKFLTDLVIS